tara:strand:+ start:2693 stop:2839 length:147 start_codon:yes stop_codon:yes gene_type:complete
MVWNQTIQVKVSKEDKINLMREAKKLRLTLSGYVRYKLLSNNKLIKKQ